ncbi:MAG: dihydropteroate synthase [Chitinophagia bacterium]|jgi:dihydropteroate synthase|nr:dihydropteroate synthase [Chitinophagia bacterium]NCA30630.1 dihydropteroate synthase [Chitinophagia bacterium]NDD16233.1 dihydropteroate synthase [Chitinophagia bacterium]
MFKIPAKDLEWQIDIPQVMGILNLTPDSFYEASRHANIDSALAQIHLFIKEGASIIDIGAQSTRPGANMEGAEIEIKRLIPYIKAIHQAFPKQLISVDTFYAKVAEEAINAGAHIINDISCASIDENILAVVAKYNAGYIGMHLTGGIDSMHKVEPRENIIETLISYFEGKKKLLSKYGIENWVIDPGFGFGKTVEENFTIVKKINELKILELPVLLGASRKSSLYKTLDIESKDALNATTVANTVALLNGANILRVHDVKEAAEIIQLLPYLK